MLWGFVPEFSKNDKLNQNRFSSWESIPRVWLQQASEILNTEGIPFRIRMIAPNMFINRNSDNRCVVCEYISTVTIVAIATAISRYPWTRLRDWAEDRCWCKRRGSPHRGNEHRSLPSAVNSLHTSLALPLWFWHESVPDYYSEQIGRFGLCLIFEFFILATKYFSTILMLHLQQLQEV